MLDLTVLKEKNPSAAEFIESWRQKYNRGYNFNREEDKALFYEALVELGRYIPNNSAFAAAYIGFNVTGLNELHVSVTPPFSTTTSAAS